MGSDLFGDWSLDDRLVDIRSGQLRISKRGEPFSLLRFHHLDGSFRGWYVNLEQPQQRTTLGFDFEDELLDIWVEQDSDPEWLDEDELEEAVLRGFFSPERAARIRTNGERVLARHFARIERHDVRGWLTMGDDAVRGYAGSWDALAPALDALPLSAPLRVRRVSTIFVAETAS